MSITQSQQIDLCCSNKKAYTITYSEKDVDNTIQKVCNTLKYRIFKIWENFMKLILQILWLDSKNMRSNDLLLASLRSAYTIIWIIKMKVKLTQTTIIQQN